MTSVTNNLTGLFGAATQVAAANSQLNKTAQLTLLAEGIAMSIINKMNQNVEEYQHKILKSQQSHDAMDDLITDTYELQSVDLEFLKNEEGTVDHEEIDKMIRSQQSKRSRSKSKVMTVDNYKTMLVGAIAENLLRLAADKPKSAGGVSSRSSDVDYTEEELQALKENQEDLKKAIRNIQSKKSIMKSKADFDPESERWHQLLNVENILISLRDNTRTVTDPEILAAAEKAAKVEKVIDDLDINSLKSSDAKSTLELIKSVLKGD